MLSIIKYFSLTNTQFSKFTYKNKKKCCVIIPYKIILLMRGGGCTFPGKSLLMFILQFLLVNGSGSVGNTLASWFRIQRTTLLQKLKNFRLQRNANYLKNIKTFLIAKWFIKFSNENEPGV